MHDLIARAGNHLNSKHYPQKPADVIGLLGELLLAATATIDGLLRSEAAQSEAIGEDGEYGTIHPVVTGCRSISDATHRHYYIGVGYGPVQKDRFTVI